MKIFKKHKNCLKKRREKDLELASYFVRQRETERQRMRKLETQKGSNMDPGKKKWVAEDKSLGRESG